MLQSDQEKLVRCGLPSNGIFGPFTFTKDERNYYWRVSGPMPLSAAERIHITSTGSRDVRVNGNCGCPAPDVSQARWIARDGRRIVGVESGKQLQGAVENGLFPPNYMDAYLITDDLSTATGTIETYHVDSEAGLRVLANVIKNDLIIGVRYDSSNGQLTWTVEDTRA